MVQKKVLVLGIGQSNYILQLYGNIKDKLPEYSFSISGFRPLSKKHIDERVKKIFDKELNLNEIEWSVLDKIHAFFSVITQKWLYKEIALTLFDGSFSINKLLKIILQENVKPFLIARAINKSDFTVLHFHFIRSQYVDFVKYLHKRFQVISTFWGSDLMRTSGHKEYYYQSLALNRSNIISCATYEMSNIVLSKYGRDLECRIRYAKFIHDPKIYELIDQHRGRNDWQQEFRMTYSIPVENKIVIIGHNAAKENNHIRILKCFDELAFSDQEKVTCVFPLTYSVLDSDYIKNLKTTAANYKMQFLFLEEFMSWEDLAKLKLIADLMIHMPVSDGLSAALTEFFYAGGLIVTGSWLPYSTFSQAGLFYYSYPDVEGLKLFLNSGLLFNFPYHTKLVENIGVIRKEFDIEAIANQWKQIFKELL